MERARSLPLASSDLSGPFSVGRAWSLVACHCGGPWKVTCWNEQAGVDTLIHNTCGAGTFGTWCFESDKPKIMPWQLMEIVGEVYHTLVHKRGLQNVVLKLPLGPLHPLHYTRKICPHSSAPFRPSNKTSREADRKFGMDRHPQVAGVAVSLRPQSPLEAFCGFAPINQTLTEEMLSGWKDNLEAKKRFIPGVNIAHGGRLRHGKEGQEEHKAWKNVFIPQIIYTSRGCGHANGSQGKTPNNYKERGPEVHFLSVKKASVCGWRSEDLSYTKRFCHVKPATF
ncbi:hypothetical protein EK904_008732 [Melospiza melodia maxima]|nr:hypothetical protein EK904_008732 [Melospiza melodia maxima]